MDGMAMYDDLIPKSKIPENSLGKWKVKHFNIDEQKVQSFNISLLFAGDGQRRLFPGKYTGLYKLNEKGYQVIMSDTPAEIRDHFLFVLHAFGDILINGLGLGIVLQALLQKTNVSSITVVEIDSDVITLIGKHFDDPRLTIVNADAEKYDPGRGVKFHSVWHDIWNAMSLENVQSISKLNRRYGQRLHSNGFQSYWGKSDMERMKREDRIQYIPFF